MIKRSEIDTQLMSLYDVFVLLVLSAPEVDFAPYLITQLGPLVFYDTQTLESENKINRRSARLNNGSNVFVRQIEFAYVRWLAKQLNVKEPEEIDAPEHP